jgi:ATP-binding cassette subfamily B protein
MITSPSKLEHSAVIRPPNAAPAEAAATVKITDRYLLWMLGQFLRPYWRQLIIVFALLLIVTGLSLLPPYLIQLAVDDPITKRDLSGLIPLGVIYFSSILLVFALRFAYLYLLQTVGQSALLNLRQRLFEHILRQDMRYFNTTPVGQIVARLSNDVEALTELVSTSFIMVVSSLVLLVSIVITMFVINWQLALIALAVLPVMTAATAFFRNQIRRTSSFLHRLVADTLAFLNEQFNGMLVVQLFGRQQLSFQEFETLNSTRRDTHMRLRDQYTIYASILQLMTAIGLGVVLYGGGSGVLAGWATLGTLIAFIQYQQRSFDPILNLAEQFAQIQTALAAGERIARMLRVEPTLTEPEQPTPITAVRGDVRFEGVHFHYEAGAPVLRGIDLHIPSGQFVAIVGATGAGKTSLAGLLARFYDVVEGRILIDGVDIRQIAFSDLRRMVAVVPQSPYCFNGTVADNLRLFNPNITDAQMRAAAEVACAAPFIERLAGGYDHVLLPGGGNLSQGQRQLLALARALLHSPEGILVLDEATSNIDSETEALIQQGLRQTLRERTSLVIAHRLSTVREADRILVMKGGQIVEDGTHAELLAQQGVYTALHQRQFADVDDAAAEDAAQVSA